LAGLAVQAGDAAAQVDVDPDPQSPFSIPSSTRHEKSLASQRERLALSGALGPPFQRGGLFQRRRGVIGVGTHTPLEGRWKALEGRWKASKMPLGNEGSDMDALTKAVVQLTRYNRLLEREIGDVDSHVGAILELIMIYIGEAKVDEKQHPKTAVAMVKVVESLQSLVNNKQSLRQEKLNTMDAMTKVFMDLAIDPSATLQ
jgi:hypothetical protein